AGMSEAQTARAANPQLSGRELARALREQRSRRGSSGQKKSAPTGRRRKAADSKPGAAKDAPWKVGASETTHGQIVTGTMVGRSHDVTGDEPSTCRGVTGTEYLGADIFRDFCQSDPGSAPRKVSVTSTSHGNAVSGNSIGRGKNVTGNEPGTCKRVTGDEYISADQSQRYCGEFLAKSPRKVTRTETGKGKAMTGSNVGRSEKVTGDEPGMNRQLTGTQYTQPEEIGAAPAKVGKSATLRGGNITGTMVGRGQRMTGDEPGSCRDITGDDYIGQEQYSEFCSTAPAPTDRKVGVSATGKGMPVTGTMTDRESKVTGNEPGTCKAVTGTPYAGADAYGNFCPADDAAQAGMRSRQSRATPGMPMTGIQPGVGGKMTGDLKGACEPLTGTPYVGADQFAAACPATPADSASPDFPQSLASAPWQQFSVSSPSGGAQGALGSTGVTGSSYEQGNITGPFGMAPGKVTGTEEARFGHETLQAGDLRPQTAAEVEGRVKSRITGEGQDAGLKITGDDWDRGNNVTGTEGTSATRRNPTMRAAPAASMSVDLKRNKDMTLPMSKVTGGSGNTERGSLVTYSGGARG
ncbi:MAG: CsoS2 family carboxysome shell protein, partial [Gammaproteobacteria bacterium]